MNGTGERREWGAQGKIRPERAEQAGFKNGLRSKTRRIPSAASWVCIGEYVGADDSLSSPSASVPGTCVSPTTVGQVSTCSGTAVARASSGAGVAVRRAWNRIAGSSVRSARSDTAGDTERSLPNWSWRAKHRHRGSPHKPQSGHQEEKHGNTRERIYSKALKLTRTEEGR